MRARVDAELAEHLVQVVLDGSRADEQLSGDVSVVVSRRHEAGDLGLLRREVAERVRCPFAGMFPGRLEFHPSALGESLHSELGKELVRGPEFGARLDPSTFASEPFAVEQMRAREVDTQSGRSEMRDRFAIEVFGGLSVGEQRT